MEGDAAAEQKEGQPELQQEDDVCLNPLSGSALDQQPSSEPHAAEGSASSEVALPAATADAAAPDLQQGGEHCQDDAHATQSSVYLEQQQQQQLQQQEKDHVEPSQQQEGEAAQHGTASAAAEDVATPKQPPSKQPSRNSSIQHSSSIARVSRSSSTAGGLTAVPGTPSAAAAAAAAASTAPAADGAADAQDAAAAAQVSSSLQHIFSLAASKRSNLHLLGDDTLAMAAGCAVLLLHLPSMQQHYLPGRDGGGVAAVGVHPSRKLFLVAEKCRSRAPSIYIYSYPDLALQHTLPAGTERAYSAACFSPDGTKLAAVGSAPDFLLTLWDWAAGATLLRCKAFSQEVYGLGFCPHTPGALVSCGTGHIRFWKMASTFTGLKLQGALGRFGAVELSDVAAFVELPDGKVLSGSEAGDLLLWEGGLIKAVICRPGGARCHEGPVEVLMHDSQTNYLLSGGGDGCLRLWEAARVQEAEPPEGSNTVEVKPAVTVALPECSISSGSSSCGSSSSGGSSSGGRACGVRGLVWLDRRTWLVQSEAGALVKVCVPLNLLDQGGYSASTLMQLQPGGVVGCATCPDRHVLLAASGDGTISAIDYRSQAVLQQRRFSSRISSTAMLPPAADPSQRCMMLGFADGCVRLTGRCSDGWEVLAAARPHKVPVVCLAVSSDGSRVAAVAADGCVFFLLLSPGSSGNQQQQLQPLVACQLEDSSPSCCCWDAAGVKLLVGSCSGVAVEVAVPNPGELDTSRSYHQQLPLRCLTARLPRQQQPQQQQQQQPADQQQPAAAVGADDSSKQALDTPAEAAASSSSSSSAQQPGPADVQQLPAAQQQPDSQDCTGAQPQQQQEQQEQVLLVEENGDDEDRPVLPITRVAYQHGSSERCLLWLGRPAAGQVLQCSWPAGQAAVIASSSTAFAGASVSVVCQSWSGAYRVVGTSDGQVLLEETGPAPRVWQCALHDMHDGCVTGLAMAFDDSCLLSAAADGTLLLLHNPLGAPLAQSQPAVEANAGLPALAAATTAAAAAQAGTPGAEESSDAVPLSLEEAKQAEQRDQQAATAAAARQQLLALVGALRQELAGLMRQDAARPPAERLPADAFHIDQGLPELVRVEREQRLAAAQAQVAYDAEVAALKLGKLRSYFEATLVEHVVAVHPITAAAQAAQPAGGVGASGGRSRSVSTIRPPELPREVQAALREAEAEAALLQDQQQQQQQGSRSPGKLTRSSQSLGQHNGRGSQRPSKGSFRARISQEVLGPDASKAGSGGAAASPSRAELWCQAKRQRAAEWAAFNAARPDDTYDAPEDVAALAHAAATVGDFKLKGDPGFMLPEEERWTPAKKQAQMLLLVRAMGEARGTHNAAVLGLRQRKRELLGRLGGMRGRLAELNVQLGVAEPLPELSMLPDEEPEQQLAAVTPAQLAEHAAAAKAAADRAAGMGALGGFAAATGTGTAGAGGKAAAGATAKPSQQPKQQQPQREGSAGGAGSVQCVRELSPPELHALQVERDAITGAASALCASFDSAVSAARAHQLQLSVDLKAAEGRLLMMLKELALLKDAESKELALEAKRAAKLAEAQELAARLAELEAAMEDKRGEGEDAAGRRAGAVGELEVLLAEQDGFREVLTKLFYRRIKRARKHGPGSAASGGDSSGDDSDGGGSDMGDDDGSGSDSSAGEEVCPPGCDPALYEAVVELRERRLDEEEAGAEVSRALEGLGKDKALLAKKARLVDGALAAINQEVLDFQVDKQARLNQLPATLSLRRHQLRLLEPQDASQAGPDAAGDSSGDAAAVAAAAVAAGPEAALLPASGALQGRDLSGALVFSSHALERLKLRMQELDAERDALRHQQKELRQQHTQMQEDRAAKEAHLAELAAHCTSVQLLKFGQVIDVGLLDTLGLRNKGADELREALKSQASAAAAELAEWDRRLASSRRALLGLLRENTAALTTVTDLTQAQRSLEARVLAGREELWVDPLGSRREALAERDRLVGRISSQGARLEELRLQLAAMRRKDSAVHGV